MEREVNLFLYIYSLVSTCKTSAPYLNEFHHTLWINVLLKNIFLWCFMYMTPVWNYGSAIKQDVFTHFHSIHLYKLWDEEYIFFVEKKNRIHKVHKGLVSAGGLKQNLYLSSAKTAITAVILASETKSRMVQ